MYIILITLSWLSHSFAWRFFWCLRLSTLITLVHGSSVIFITSLKVLTLAITRWQYLMASSCWFKLHLDDIEARKMIKNNKIDCKAKQGAYTWWSKRRKKDTSLVRALPRHRRGMYGLPALLSWGTKFEERHDESRALRHPVRFSTAMAQNQPSGCCGRWFAIWRECGKERRRGRF